MKSIKSLLDMGMTLKSTDRQLKNGTYVLHSDAVKTTYFIYTNTSDGLIKRITYRYDLQHHSQDGKISKATPGMSVEEAIPHIIEQYNKYLKKHIELSFGVKDGEKLVSLIFSDRTTLIPKELLEGVFSDTQLIILKDTNEQISKNELYKILCKRRACILYVKPLTSDVITWATMCETLLKEYDIFVNVYEVERTRDGLAVSAKNYLSHYISPLNVKK